jgi:hypothetical protein
MAGATQEAKLIEQFKKLLQEKSSQQLTIKCEDRALSGQQRYGFGWQHGKDEEDVLAYNENAIKDVVNSTFEYLSNLGSERRTHYIPVLNVSIYSTQSDDITSYTLCMYV